MTNDKYRMTKEVRSRNEKAGRTFGLRHSSFVIRHSPPGFTFVEVLAALMFLAILVPVLISGLTLANRASVLSERSALAAELGENKLNEMLLNDAWTTADVSGEFGQDFSPDATGYRWELSRDNWDTDNMTNLTLTVFFKVQGREHNVRLSTLATPNSTQSQTQTTTSS